MHGVCISCGRATTRNVRLLWLMGGLAALGSRDTYGSAPGHRDLRVVVCVSLLGREVGDVASIHEARNETLCFGLIESRGKADRLRPVVEGDTAAADAQ